MNVTIALDMIIKYGQYIPLLIDAGMNITNAVKRMVQLAQGAKDGTLTDDEIAAHRKALDDLIDEFNAEI